MSVNIKENNALNGIAKLIPASNITLSSLPDTNITLPQAEQSLGYDEASGRWINYNVRISVYYSDDFRGLNISCTKGQTTITKTAPMDGNAVVFYVNEKGTWTVSAEIGATSYTDTVVVTSFGVTYPAQLVTSSSQTPEGATVEPTDDIQTWLACANLDKPYTTLEAVLADRETFETLIADSNACDYMARSTTWAKAEGIVPKMTSNTTPSGECIGSGDGYSSTYSKWMAFNPDEMRGWLNDNTQPYIHVNNYVGYTPTSANRAISCDITLVYYSSGNTVVGKIQGYDGTTWTDLTENITVTSNANDTATKAVFTKNVATYTSYRWICVTAPTNNYTYGLKLQFYADADIATNQDAMALIGKYDYCSTALLSNATWAEAIANSDYFEEVLNVSVPTMTSNTTPSGEVIASGSNSSGSHPYWHAFDKSTSTYWINTTGNPNYIGYDFGYDVEIHKVVLTNLTGTGVKLQGYDGSDWVDIDDSILADSGTKTYIVSASTTYQKFRLVNATQLYEAQFYGRASSEVLVPLVPTMTSNTTPSGEVLYGNMMTGSESYKAFDKNESNNTQGNTGTISTFYIGYDFGTPTVVNSLTLKASCYVATYYYKLKPQGYNGSEWVDIGTDELTVQSAMGSPQTLTLNLNNTTAYSKYRLLGTTTNTSGSKVYIVNVTQLYIYELQFYQKTVQTNIVHSSANDTIYYMEDNSPVIVATTNSDGDGILDFSSLEDKEYTFYSSVAKDPSNLSNDYSKAIRITKSEFGGTTEMYLMPDTVKTLYWFGYESDNLEDCTSANGWSIYTATLVAPTHNTNNIRCNPNNSNLYIAGVGNKTATSSSTTLAFIYQGITVVSNIYGELTYGNSKNLSSSYSQRYINSSSITKDTQALSSGQYCCIQASRTRSIDIYAIWYE